MKIAKYCCIYMRRNYS